MGSNSASNGGSDSGFSNKPTKSKLSKKNQAKVDRKNKAEANVEMGLGKDRMSNYSTSQGGTKQTGGDNNNQVVKAPVVPVIPVIPKVVAPTESEVSQATATDATEDTIETRKKKTKAKGRSATILSSARGVRSDEGLTLGKRSLLGS